MGDIIRADLRGPKDRLVIALDVDSEDEALDIVRELGGAVGMFKVGHQLFTAYGPAIVRKIRDKGGSVFLDLKYHDIPNTVAKASIEAVKLGVSIFNVHALGGLAMMRAAADAAGEASVRFTMPLPRVLAVTVLTSMDEQGLRRELKITRSLLRTVGHFAKLAERSGLHGVVASPKEIHMLRKTVRSDFLILTPGVRPDWAGKDDQKRTMTPGQAVAAGADYIVLGRPILNAADRREAVSRVLQEMTAS